MNRIIANVYIVDSGGHWLTANSAANGDFLDARLASVGLWATSGGDMEISFLGNTATAIFRISNGSAEGMFRQIEFAAPFCVKERMFVKTLVSGTGYLYFA